MSQLSQEHLEGARYRHLKTIEVTVMYNIALEICIVLSIVLYVYVSCYEHCNNVI